MRALFFFILISLLNYQNIQSQCDYIIPPAVKKIKQADRLFIFSDVTINGQKSTYLEVKKGAKVKIKTKIESRQDGNYCPNCIVQLYWGIRDYSSTCAKSFHGYWLNKKKSTLKFNAPQKDGIYFITMGASLEYSCKNNLKRPECPAKFAFAILKVGNPDPEEKITLETEKKGNDTFLKTSLIKSGCFGKLDKVQWFLNNKKLAFDDQQEIKLSEFGTYKVTWSNCLHSASETFEFKNKIEDTTAKPNENLDIETLVKTTDKFVLKNLIFDLGKSFLLPEAKKELDKLAKIMVSNPTMRILLEGHTDVRGNAKLNQKLSEKRVKSAKRYLISQGVAVKNIETKGWGDEKPLVLTKDIEKGKINRRVEVQILVR